MVSGSLVPYAADHFSMAAFASSVGPAKAGVEAISITGMNANLTVVNRRGGPDADRHDKSLIHITLEGACFDAASHPGLPPTCTLVGRTCRGGLGSRRTCFVAEPSGGRCATTANPLPLRRRGPPRVALSASRFVCSASLDGAWLVRLFCAPNRASATPGLGFRFRRARSSASRRRRSRVASDSTP